RWRRAAAGPRLYRFYGTPQGGFARTPPRPKTPGLPPGPYSASPRSDPRGVPFVPDRAGRLGASARSIRSWQLFVYMAIPWLFYNPVNIQNYPALTFRRSRSGFWHEIFPP